MQIMYFWYYIFIKAPNLFKFKCEITLNPFLEPTSTKQVKTYET